MARNPTSLNSLFSEHTQLRRLLEETRAHSLLVDELREQLTPDIRAHCVGARLENDTLVVLADSAAWATRLRYSVPSIMSRLAARNLRVQVTPSDKGPIKAQTRPPAELSEAAASALMQTAEYLEDPELAAAMRRLAAHHSVSNGNK